MDLTSTFAPIAKTVEQDDGSLLVYGKATDGGLDLDDQRCDPTWLSTAMPEWFSSAGNIRAQHRADSAVGKATEHTFDADGHYITARIVDRDAIAKTRAGIFTGFSIGIRRPKIVKSPTAPNGLINGGMITEVSLCDRPANPACTLMLCKAAASGWEGRTSDFDAERGLVKCEDLNFYPENEIRLKTVSEPIEPVEQAQAEVDAPQVSFAPAESKAPQNPTFSDAGKTAVSDEPEFDREAAIALVNKATDGLGQDETGDIAGANAAIAAIAQLIISEAKDLAEMPAQSCDIHLLMSAVDALRCFARREQMEQNAVDPDSVIYLAVGADALPGTVNTRGELVKAKYSADELKAMLKAGKAMKNPNGDPSYPIGDKSDLSNAIHAVGRGSGDHDSIRSYIKRRASALGASDMIPESWTKMAEATTTKADNVSDTLTSDSADVADVENVEPVEKAATDVATDEPTEEVAEQPEATKAVGAAPDQDSLVKAFTAALSEEDSPIRKMFVDIVEASTKSVAEALSTELGARLEKVEQMATPGGPTLRRTEVERVNARKSDLGREVMRYKSMASAAEDPDLRKGYMQKALQVEAEFKAL
jgi:hypothetical protein